MEDYANAIQSVLTVAMAVVGAILLDWWMRRLSERRCRLRLLADIESYLNPSKRL